MADERIEKLADLLVNYSVEVKAGQEVFIRGSSIAEPLLQAVYIKVLQAGGNPWLSISYPGQGADLFRYANDQQLQYVPKPYQYIYEHYDVLIDLLSESNTRELNRVDPQKMVLRHQAFEGNMKTLLKRAANREMRWTLSLFPTQAYAQDADMSLSEFEDFVYQACMPDRNDPIGYWKRFSARQQKIVDWLNGKQTIHVIGPETDLRMNVSGRTFINCDCHENVPDGEVLTGPVEDSMEGHVVFSYPAITGGREIAGVRLWFDKGKVVKATADKNEDYLLKTLDTDEGARRVGEFAIGTNEGITRFTREILFDEKIGGSFHIAVGSGLPETGSLNQSAIRWDMICDLRHGGQIWADDQLLYENGHFTLDL
ncbi:MAG: aminopeptidase [Anaerolineaceae bacterium]|jgi:aminopeptidase